MEILRCNIQSTFLLQRLPASCVLSDFQRLSSCSYLNLKVFESQFKSRAQICRFRMPRRDLSVRAMDDDSYGVFALDDYSTRPFEYIVSSSEGEDSDGGEIIYHPISDIDLPTSKEGLLSEDDSVTLTARRFATIGETSNKRSGFGVMNTVGLALISTIFLLVVDHCAWRIARMPLSPFYLMRPFLISLTLVPCFGYICPPLFRVLKLASVLRQGGGNQYSSKMTNTSISGIFFVLIGILVAEAAVKFSSTEVFGASVATILLTAIGVLSDYFCMNKKIKGVSVWIRGSFEVAVGACFSYWMYRTDILTPYTMKMVVPLPSPIGLICANKIYPILTSLCFFSTVNAINLTDGLDELSSGTAALAFIGMSIVVIPICSELSIFGASMAGACIGYLFHCHYNTNVSISHTGALALGGALAAMASCTGMFFPLLILSGVFIIETLSVITQVSWFKATEFVHGKGHKLLRITPLHYHLVSCGFRKCNVVAAAYFLTSLLVVYASYVGLSSV